MELAGKRFLELGAGSGLISFYAVRKKAIVTATDINSVAIDYLQKNSAKNSTPVEIIHSDLFDSIPSEPFDVIAINPPYYKKDPGTAKEYAWYCGTNGEYFEKLFYDLSKYIHTKSEVIIVLCEGCDINMIKSIASKNNFLMVLLRERQNVLEKDFIYQITSGNAGN